MSLLTYLFRHLHGRVSGNFFCSLVCMKSWTLHSVFVGWCKQGWEPNIYLWHWMVQTYLLTKISIKNKSVTLFLVFWPKKVGFFADFFFFLNPQRTGNNVIPQMSNSQLVCLFLSAFQSLLFITVWGFQFFLAGKNGERYICSIFLEEEIWKFLLFFLFGHAHIK